MPKLIQLEPHQTFVADARKQILNHMRNHAIDRAGVAARLGISRSRLSYLLNAQTVNLTTASLYNLAWAAGLRAELTFRPRDNHDNDPYYAAKGRAALEAAKIKKAVDQW